MPVKKKVIKVKKPAASKSKQAGRVVKKDLVKKVVSKREPQTMDELLKQTG